MLMSLDKKSVKVLSFQPGEDVMTAMKKYCERENVQAGSFAAIGAVREVELAWYDVDEKKYETRVFEEKLEIASLVGNVSVFRDEIVIHAHGVFSGKDFKAIGGHVNRAIVGPACEITLWPLAMLLVREPDDRTGLKLLTGTS